MLKLGAQEAFTKHDPFVSFLQRDKNKATCSLWILEKYNCKREFKGVILYESNFSWDNTAAAASG